MKRLMYLSVWVILVLSINVINAQDELDDSFLEIEISDEAPQLPWDLGWLLWDGEKYVNSKELFQKPGVFYPRSVGTIFNNKIYKLGHRTEDQNKDTLRLIIYDLNNPEGGFIFKDSPIKAAYKSAMVVQGNGVDNCLYVFSRSDEDDSSFNKLFEYNLKTEQWADLSASFPSPCSQFMVRGNNVSPLGHSSLLVFESVLAEDSFRSPITSTRLGLYNTITKTYLILEDKLPFTAKSILKSEEDIITVQGQNENNKSEVYQIKLVDQSRGFTALDIAVIVLYFLLMLFIGFYFSKRQKTADDYFKGGRRIPFWAAGLSLIGTGLSAISFMAVPAKAFATDWAYFAIRFTTIFIPILIGLLYIPVFRRLDLTTAYEYLQKRFNLAVRLIGSFAFIVFQLGRIGIVLFLPAVALNVVTGFDVVTCIVLMGVISMIYTVMGGIEAVIWTDVLQVVILYGGIILCVAFISISLDGGIREIVHVGSENNKFNIFNFSWTLQEPTFWVVVFGSFFTNLTTYSADQTMVQRYFTTRTAKDATKSIWTTVIIGFALGWLFFFMGTALFAYYQEYPEQMLHTMASNDGVFPWYIISQLPGGLSGLLIAGLFAAAMSSLSSSMNSAATAYTMDFHKLYAKDFDAVRIGRMMTIIIGVGGVLFAIMFATLNVKSIWDEFLKIIGLFTGGLGGVFLLGVLTRKANGAGVLVGLIASAVIQYFVGMYKPFNLLLFTASGFISCFIIGYISSLLLPAYNKPIDDLTIFSKGLKK